MSTIIVDSRESRSRMAEKLRQMGLQIVIEELESGDYVLAEGLAVERKTASDFVISILDRRLFVQAPLLKQVYARPFIVIEGNVHATRSSITSEALAGALSYLAVIEGIQVLMTAHVDETAQLLATMHRHAVEGLGYQIALRGGKPKDRTLQVAYLLEGLPGVGPVAAQKLAAHFDSASAVFSASIDELRAVAGVGKTTAQTIHEVVRFSVSGGPKV